MRVLARVLFLVVYLLQPMSVSLYAVCATKASLRKTANQSNGLQTPLSSRNYNLSIFRGTQPEDRLANFIGFKSVIHSTFG